MKSRYQAGNIKDVEVKEKLAVAINSFLDPIRKRRTEFENNPDLISQILEDGNKKARAEAGNTLKLVLKAIGLQN